MANGLKHFFIDNSGTALPFTSKQQGGDKKKLPPRDRLEHGQLLQQKLNGAWKQAIESDEERKAVSLPTKQGVYLEFDSAPDFEIATKSLENRKVGIRLLNVREEEADGKRIRRATVFIPKGKESYYLKKIEGYVTEVTDKDKPKNQNLIEGIDDIKLAVVESFWQGDKRWIPGELTQWCEIWLSSDNSIVESEFRILAGKLRIPLKKETLKFPERQVILADVNIDHLKELIASSPYIAEFRRAAETAAFFTELENKEQTEWAKDLVTRIQIDVSSKVAICLLDTGVNNGHMLLSPLLKDADCQTYENDWGTYDHEGHGTRMSGIAGYGDLQAAIESSGEISIAHRLESIKILPPKGENDPQLYGAITSQAASSITIDNPDRKRIYCMAITAPKFETGDGRPSSWSAAIDELAAGYLDEQQKLIFVSAGNVTEMDDWKLYPESNKTRTVQNPGQSWNAVTVGAYTEKTTFDSSKYSSAAPLAPGGGLSPFSSTSLIWDKKWPIKPDIVLEGGNILKDTFGCYECEEFSVLTTYYKPAERQFDIINATSAATARAAWMAAKIQTEYLNAWPETIRALMIHSAEWTTAMRQQFLRGENKSDYKELLKVCGYGVPNLEKALWCAKNSVNLVIQSELQPYDKSSDGKRYVTKDMHIHELPWPNDVLLSMGEAPVSMRVTLSYFIEPGPGEIGWKDRYRYASSALRFDVNGTDTKDAFLQRINAAAEAEEEGYDSDGGSVNWLLGKQSRHLGSIHSDIWSGTAAELATSNMIGVYPAIGWWRERAWIGRWSNRIRYSLIVSLQTPEQDVDLYTPIMTKIKVPLRLVVNNSRK